MSSFSSFVLDYCPIPVMVEHLNANYDDWKSQYNSPSSSEGEAEAEAVSSHSCLLVNKLNC